MADATIRSVIDAIHSSPTQAVFHLSGGASQVLGWLLSVPGASNTVLEAVVPYSRMSTIQLLGKIPSQFVSQQTAEEMALLAYNRALKISKFGSPALGVGFTGTLASTSQKLGPHRFHVATRTANCCWISTCNLVKGLRTREQEDKVSSLVLLQAVARACKISGKISLELSDSEFPIENKQDISEDDELKLLLDGTICFKQYSFSGVMETFTTEKKIILSGSFNPLHDGHLKLMEVAKSICGDVHPCFEMTAVNADKPPLSVSQIKCRVKQFEKAGKSVIVSNEPLFYKKAELFPGSAFIIGVDTASRLINPQYYDDNPKRMVEALNKCRKTGCTFLVAGRSMDGVFKVLEDIEVPMEIGDMFISIPAQMFRMDISSTQIRKSMEIL